MPDLDEYGDPVGVDPGIPPTVPAGGGALRGAGAPDPTQALRQQRDEIVQRNLAALRDTTDSIRKGRDNQINLPLLRFAAGMLSQGPGPGWAAPNFGQELGRGLQGLAQGVHEQRSNDIDFYKRLAEMQHVQGQMEEAPITADLTMAQNEKMQELRGSQNQELARQRGSQALAVTESRMNRPIPIPGTGELYIPNALGPGKHAIRKPDGSLVPVTSGGSVAGPAVAAPGEYVPPTPEQLERLTKVHSEIKPEDADDKRDFGYLASLDPKHARQAWAVANYQIDPEKLTTTRAGAFERQQLIDSAMKFDPSYEPARFQSVQGAKREWATGTSAKNVISLNKSINHVTDLLSAYSAVGNGDIPMLNKIANTIGAARGESPAASYHLIAKAVGDEVAKFFAGSGGSALADREEIAKSLDPNQSPAQLQAKVRYLVDLMQKQAEPMAAMKQEALGNRRKIGFEDLLDKSSRESLKALKEHDITTPEGRAQMVKRLPPVVGVEGAPPKVAEPETRAYPTPNSQAIQMIQQGGGDPALVQKFESVFGPGSAARHIKGATP